MKLLLTMGYQPKKHVWKAETAALILLDWEKKQIVKELTYVSPSEQAAPSGHMLFACAHLMGRRLLVPTATELLFVDLETWQIETVLSLPQFNDLHHAVLMNDHLYVCNTGLQAIHKLTLDGRLLDTYSANDVPTWETYGRDTDYRGISTKPHAVHPNHLFVLDGKLWVTRFCQQDAVQVDDHSRRLNIGIGNPHDGLVASDLVYFTTTNGHIVASDPITGARARDIDLNCIDSRRSQLGWCRGLHLLDNKMAFVCFTAFRPTQWKNMAHWVLQDGKMRLPSRLSLFDMEKGHLVDEMVFSGKWDGALIFSIIPVPD